MKRIIGILIVVSILLTALVGCKENNKPLSTDGTVESTQANSEENIEGVEEQNKDLSTDNKGTSSTKNTSTSKDKVVPSSQVGSTNSNTKSQTTSKNTQTTSSTNSPQNDQTKQMVIQSNSSMYKNYPELTYNYKYPKLEEQQMAKNSSGIYENIYAKVDTNTAKQGYILISYKDPWAQKIQFSLEETATHSGMYQKTHYYKYNQGDFTLDKPIALALPKTDAIYYLVVSSVIEGVDAIKLCVDIGQVTVDGYASYQDMVPSEETIKMSKTSNGIYTNKYVKINTNTTNKGYIEVEYLDSRGYDINISMSCNKNNQNNFPASLQIKSGKNGKCKINVPLTYGDAEYTITVVSCMKNESTGVERGSKKAILTVKLSNVSSTGPFLLSTAEVNFDSSMMFIKKANEIAATCKDDFEKVSKIYDWVTSYIKYSIEEETVQGQYICDLNKIYNRKTGVCYDYAVVLAAMLRSQGIPCKVVFGNYANSTYGHVWNEVYIAKNGSITSNKMSITGNKWCRLDPTFSWTNSGQAAIDFMNNDSNYVWRSCY